MKKYTLYHTSPSLFFEFDFSKSEAGDLNVDLKTGEIILGAFFSENPIPYYPNNFVYKCDVIVSNDDCIVGYDKFCNGSKEIGEAHIRCLSRISILEIAEIQEEEQLVYHRIWQKEHEATWDNETPMGCKWLKVFTEVFNKNKITLT